MSAATWTVIDIGTICMSDLLTYECPHWAWKSSTKSTRLTPRSMLVCRLQGLQPAKVQVGKCQGHDWHNEPALVFGKFAVWVSKPMGKGQGDTSTVLQLQQIRRNSGEVDSDVSRKRLIQTRLIGWLTIHHLPSNTTKYNGISILSGFLWCNRWQCSCKYIPTSHSTVNSGC